MLIKGGVCRRSQAPEHVRYLRQFVRLTGLGSESFPSGARIFDDVRQRFAELEGVVGVEEFSFGRYEGHACVDLHARYLTERRLASGQCTVPFTPDVDPNHALEEARGTKYVRLADNVVQYSRKVVEEDGVVR